MKQVNIIVKSSVQEQEKFIGTYPEKNLLTIDAEGQIIQDDVITHGIKIGDGETKWDDLPFLKLPPDIANDWKVLAESATNGQLVTLPDLNFAYLLIDAEKLDNAQYTEIVNQIASRNIGLYLAAAESEKSLYPDGSQIQNYALTINTDEDKPFITQDPNGATATNSIVDRFIFNTSNESKYDKIEVKLKDSEAQEKIEQLKATVDDKFTTFSEQTKKDIEQVKKDIKESTYIFGSNNIPEGTTSGLIPFPEVEKRTKDYFLSGAGTWEQIILTADKVKYTTPTGNQTYVKDVLDDLLSGASLSFAQGNATDRQVFIVGATQEGLNNKKTTLKYSPSVYLDCKDNVLYGGAWNDIAEFRESFDSYAAGNCVYETARGKLMISDKRMIPNSYIVSDTYGYALGEKDIDTVPVTIAGRVLAYYLEDKNELKIGDAVCSGPNGAVCKMKKWEKILHPECIIGYVSEIPHYEIWGQHNTSVRNRVWIKVK